MTDDPGDAAASGGDGWTSTEQAAEYGAGLLVGETVRLRPATDADLDPLVGWLLDPAVAVLQSQSYPIESAADTRARVAGWVSNSGVTGGANFVVDALDSGAIVGAVNLFGGGLPHRVATAAIQVRTDALGRGYGSEALAIAVGFGFRELGLNRIQLETGAFNTRAIRAYEKAGFAFEGRRRQAVFHDGRFHDQVTMAILFDEWSARR